MHDDKVNISARHNAPMSSGQGVIMSPFNGAMFIHDPEGIKWSKTQLPHNRAG